MAKRLTSMVLAAVCLAWPAVAAAQLPAPTPGGPVELLTAPGAPPAMDCPPPPPTGLIGPVFSPPETCCTEPIVHFGYEFLMWTVSRQRAFPFVTRGSIFDPVPG